VALVVAVNIREGGLHPHSHYVNAGFTMVVQIIKGGVLIASSFLKNIFADDVA